jgi:hypothetical protein
MAAVAAAHRSKHLPPLDLDADTEALTSIERKIPSDPTLFFLDVCLGKQGISALGVQWPQRRLVVDHRMAYFCKPGSDVEIDRIPLEEVEEVRPLGSGRKDPLTTANDKASREIADRDPFNIESENVDPLCVFVIRTSEKGFNAGEGHLRGTLLRLFACWAFEPVFVSLVWRACWCEKLGLRSVQSPGGLPK